MASRCKGVGTNLSLLANHKWGFQASYTRIGEASRCKAAPRTTSHMRPRARDHYTSSIVIGRKRPSRCKFASHYAWGTNGVCECKMGVKVYMNSYMASNGSCFMVTWTSFKNQLLEVGSNKIGRPWHSACSQPLIYFILSCVRTYMNRNLLK
jgi:hypothetical protein